MITIRTFEVSLYGNIQDVVFFVGEEYNEKTVKLFLLAFEAQNKNIEVRQIKEKKI